MASANHTSYPDPSALVKLYLHEAQSRAMATWRAKSRGPVTISAFGLLEVTNALALAAHRHFISPEAHRAAVQALDDDLLAGRTALVDLPWRATLERARDLSRQHTPALGTRTLDLLHVASACELGAKTFLTYDLRQQRLAEVAGLRVLAPV